MAAVFVTLFIVKESLLRCTKVLLLGANKREWKSRVVCMVVNFVGAKFYKDLFLTELKKSEITLQITAKVKTSR